MSKRQSQSIRFEALEQRQLLSGTPWAFFGHLIGQDAVAQQFPNLTGKGESIAIIDQGVDYNHPVLGGGFGAGKKVEAGWDFSGNDPYPFCDTFAHGTAGAGILAGNPYTFNGTYNQGINPQANLIALRQTSQAGIKAAFDWVLANRAKYNIVAVNFTDPGFYPHANYTPEIAALYNAGVFVATPAGNGGPSQGTWDSPYAFTVGGIGHNDQLTSFSARGAGVDMVGPADGVTVPYYDVSRHTHIITDAGQGTSWAAPYVVGAAAMIKQINPRFSAGQIMAILKDSGHWIYDGTSRRSYSRLDLYAAVKLAYARAGIAAPSAVAAPVPATTVQSPFSGTPIGIAATGTTIQAENYDKGGDGVAYHDADAANVLGQYRTAEGVDVEATADTGGGYDVGCVRAGEWIEYTVSVPTTGNYDISFRLASNGVGGTFHLEQDGVAKTGAINIINTGGWQKWQTGTIPVSLTAGTHVLKIAMDANGPSGYVGNFNWFSVKPIGATATPAPATIANGLIGQYYDNADFTNLKFTRTDAYVSANYGTGSPDPSMGADYFSMRWTGKIVPRYSETYTFHTLSDDGVRLWINGQLVIDNWTTHTVTENTGKITLQAGVKYDIKLEYCDATGPAQIGLGWQSAHQALEIVPTSQLFVA